MKLPSLREVFLEGRATFRRFPVVICGAALTTGAALFLVDHEGPAEPTILFKILLAGILGIPLLTALTLVAERRHLGRSSALGLQIVGVVLLVGYAVTVPSDLTHAPLAPLFQFFVLAAALHLFVAVAPFLARGEVNGFWQFNRIIFLRFLTALLYTGVLYIGLAIALAALDNLFGVDVPGKRYGELWVLLIGMFTTWFLLAGVPDDLAQLEQLTDYPRGIRVFAQYILLPIVVVYFVILYAYLAKILTAWEWPEGWVSKLILGFSGTGIFLLLLLHPIMGRTGYDWITKALRWFYVTLLPLVVVLFLAVWRRVSEYAITEGRYLAIALGVWILFLIVYFTLSRAKNIKVVPLSLCILAFAVSFGPWGTFSVAERSQIARLESFVSAAGILADGKVQPVHGEVPFEDAKQISAILSYLHEIHGFGGIQHWFRESLREDTISSGVAFKRPAVVAGMMGLDYVERWRESIGEMVTLDAENAFDVEGYDRILNLSMFGRSVQKGKLPGDGISYMVPEENDRIVFTSDSSGTELLQIDLRRHAETLLASYRTSASGRVPNEAMAVSGAAPGLKVRLCLWQIRLQQRSGVTKVIRASGTILYSVEKRR